MNRLQVISGQALLGEHLAFEPVDIEIKNGIITAVEENPRAPQVWICPAFFNAHTHLGDTIAMDCTTSGALEALVTPPFGLKHRLLAAAPRHDLIDGMRASVNDMISSGTFGCADFREGGVEGVRALQEAVTGLAFQPVIFGREGGEAEAAGLGISSTRDINGIEQRVTKAKKMGKKIAFHAGEQNKDDIDAALAYDPDLLVHMTHATKKQIRECAEKAIPIAICPRSNWILSVTSSTQHPPVNQMQELGCTVLLGTDNAMFVSPDMFSEMSFVSYVYHLNPQQIIRAAVQGSELTKSSFFIKKGVRAAFFTIDPSRSAIRFSRDPLSSIVKRACAGWIGKRVFNL
ncbi:MAG: amidohydrolase family protein [Methanoregula sp.]|nr:amidohydrolase family protein [Methanoregula sp.]